MPSIMQRVGTPNARHNVENSYRKHLDNVNPELSQYNRVISRRSIEEIYAQELQPAFDEFNGRQKRNDRRLDVKWGVSSALEYQRAMDVKARASKNSIDQKGKPPIREIVWQIGNPEQGFGCAGQTDESREKIFAMLQECQEEAQRRYPQFSWGDIVIHADEVSTDADDKEHGSIHLHASFVPICYQNKQGPAAQVAFERCLKEMGFDSFNAWKHDLDQLMEDVLESHGMERTYMDNHEKHQDSTQFHRQQDEIRRTKEYEAVKGIAQERLASVCYVLDQAVQNAEKDVSAYAQDLMSDIAENASTVYGDAMFYIQHCDDDAFDQISQRGRELRRSIVAEDLDETTNVKPELSQQIRKAAAGEISWADRSYFFSQYRDVTERFWELQKELSRDYPKQINDAQERRRNAARMYYDTQYLLYQSRSLLVTMFLIIKMLVAEARMTEADWKIAELERLRNDLVRNTSSFAQYSRAYRDDLKAGRFPGQAYLDAMVDVVSKLDREYQRHHDQILAPQKHDWERNSWR